MNESKKHDPRSWAKWESSGAISVPPQVQERREKEAEAWLREQYHFDLSKLSNKEQQKLIESVETSYKEYNHPVPYRAEVLEKIQAHPVLSLEEIKARNGYDMFGSTNNFWSSFFPEKRQSIRENIEKGESPKDVEAQQIIYWQMKDILFPAFERVGFDQIRQMHKAIETYIALDQEWKQRIGDNPMGLRYGVRSIPQSPLISDEEKEIYTRSQVIQTNVLRSLAVELTKDGIPFAAMHR